MFALAGSYSGAQAATLHVPAGGDLQGAILAAQPGDTVVLEAGATFSGTFHLPLKSGDAYVTIQSSRAAELPEGQRVTPAQSHLMSKIVTPGLGNPALHTVAGAHHYRLIGIEFAPATADTFTYELVTLGAEGAAQDTLAEVPHHITIDRCYIHAWPNQTLKRGVTVNSAHTEIINSYISDFKSTGEDTQAILGWNGPGPFRIVNNYLEASGENLMFGGGDPSIPGLVPSDIEIRRNYFHKPLSWRGVWMVKNLLELKNAQRVTVDGNVFENCWSSGQNGTAIMLTPRNQYGGAPWSRVQDVLFINNTVRHVANGFQIAGHDNIYQQTVQTNHITIRNNVFEDISSQWTSTGQTRFLTIIDTDSVTVDHNTIFQQKSIFFGYGAPNTNFVYTNNLSNYGEGIQGDGAGVGNEALAQYFPGSPVTANVLVGGAGVFWDGTENHYPLGNYYPPTWEAVGFVRHGGGLGGDYRLAASSPYNDIGTDARDLGADIDQLEAAQSGAAPTPAPTPTPISTPTPTPTPTTTPTPTPQGTYSVTAQHSSASPGSTVTVNWVAPAGHSASDWVGFYQVGDAEGSYLSWQYAGYSTSGQMYFIAPYQAGQYEFRLFLNDGFTRAATSGTLTVGAAAPTPTPTPYPGNLFSDDFDDNIQDTTKWRKGAISVAVGDATVAETAQAMQVTPPAWTGGVNTSGYLSVGTYDCAGKSVSVEVSGTTTNDPSTLTVLEVGTAQGGQWARVILQAGTLYYQYRNGSGEVTVAATPYVPSLHRWWAIRHDSSTDTLYWETAQDGSAWTTRAVLLRASVALTSMATFKVSLNAGTTASVGSPGVARFDNFSLRQGGQPAPTPAPVPPQGGTQNDDFNDDAFDSSRWSLGSVLYGASPIVAVRESQQRLEVSPPVSATGTQAGGYTSLNSYDLTNSRVAVEVYQVLNYSGDSNVYTALEVSNGETNYARVFVTEGFLYFGLSGAGAGSSNTWVPYDPMSHRWWRIRHSASGDVLYWETSPDNQTWTAQRTFANVTGVLSTLGNTKASLVAATFGVLSNPGTARFDNFTIEWDAGSTGTLWANLTVLGHAESLSFRKGTRKPARERFPPRAGFFRKLK